MPGNDAKAISISVVIPYFNGSRFIGEAVASVRAQTLAPLEIIVVDDGSRPEEAAALDRDAAGCTVVHLPRNRGVSVARNTGIARARGEWIAFLDCDDLWDPRKLELQAAYVAAHPDCLAVHCGLRNVAVDGTQTERRKEDVTLEDFLEFPLAIFPSAAIMQRQALFECGLFDPALRCCQDLALFMRFCLLHGRFHAVPDPLLIRRVQKDGVSRNVAVFWDEAERAYRGVLSLFEDQRGAREVMREIHIDMLLRTLYLRDGALARRIVRRATRADVSHLRLFAAVLWRAIRLHKR
jgi:glycosyltransferase involved in cell wall biosynthesis